MTHPLTPFLWRHVEAPYVADWVTPPVRVFPVTCKTGIGTPRTGSVAHRTTAVAAILADGRMQYGARWCCGLRSSDAILLASETSHGGPVCFNCDPQEPSVYRCFSAAGELLYIGSTIKPRQRMKAHSLNAPWWPEVADITYERFPTAADAFVGERLAILAESPSRNKQGLARP